MSNPNSTNKNATGAHGAKMLITSAALAATIGGWALLTTHEASAVVKVNQALAPTAPAQSLALDLPPIPTLVPPQHIVVQNSPAQATSGQPPVLREVSAPPMAAGLPVQGQAPASVTVTQSSR